MPLATRRDALKSALVWAIAARLPSIAQAAEPYEISRRERDAMNKVGEAFREKYAVPGLSVAIAHHGRIVYDEALGLANRETDEKLTTAHRFRIASVSKPITSVAIFDLIEDKRLTLDAKVFGRGGVLGTKFGKTPYGPSIEDITVEHLLTHTSGGWSNRRPDPMFGHPQMSHAELISWTLDNVPLENRPGTSYAYSNFGYCLLGRVIEAIGERSYADHVQQRVFDRCGLRGMLIAGNTAAERAPREVLYHGQDNEFPYGMNVRRMDSHGGWLATARELTTFATRVDGFTTTKNILQRSTVNAMVAPSAANTNYAKGWAVNRVNNWWHNGSLPGTASVMVRTASGFCWAALANTRRSNSDMNPDLDRMVWNMVREVAEWR